MSAGGGYYAYENGRWMYHGAQGQTRFASPQEVAGINARYPNGAPATLTEQDATPPQSDGSGLVGGPPQAAAPAPTPAPALLDTGGGSSNGPAPAPPAPTGNPPPVNPTGGIHGWNTGGVQNEPWWQGYAGGDQSYYRTPTDVNKIYYDKDPQAAWWQYAEDTGYGKQFQNYVANNYERYMSRFKALAEANPDMHLTDFLTKGLGQQIYNEFQLQAPEARGVNARLYDPGRFNAQF
jgi:hypothetical protein